VVRRVLKYTNALVVLLILTGLWVFYSYVWRSYPDYSGDLALAVQRNAQIVRDEHGVPHIKAASIEDAVYLQGYVHAQDRFWQMEAVRRLAAGEIAEIVGPAALERDLDSRRLRLRITAHQMEKGLNDEDRKWFAAYARGVNDWLSAHRDNLPVEIRVLNFTPKPWSIVDSLLLGLHMYRQMSTTWTLEADRARLVSRAEPAKFRQLFPLRTGTEIALGSNAWALAPSRTETGKPILAGDPHMELSWPSTFYLNHLEAEDLDCIGGSLPGAPGIIIGHNQNIAWSMTNLHFDVQDLYVNENRVIAHQRETIKVKGRPDIEAALPLTPHGPLIERGGQAYALRWAPYDGQYSFPFIQLDRARNWTDFRTALSRFPGPSHNFMYADSAGNIGYQAAGRMPLRRTIESDLPLDATKPDNEWFGFIPFEELPSAYNPPSGVLITANQNPFPVDYKYPVAGAFTPPYRQRQIAARLASQPKWNAQSMTSIQMDVYSAFHHYFAQQLANAAKKRSAAREDFSEARDILAAWNGQMEIGQAAPLIAVLAYQHFSKAVFRRATGGDAIASGQFTPAAIETLLRQRPKDWFPDFDQVLVEALLAALDEASKQQGKNPRFWDYGRYSRIFVANPVLSQAVNIGQFLARPGVPFTSWLAGLRLPLIDSYVQAGPLPLSGAGLTVKQVTPTLGQAFRFIADTANWENSYLTITLGQSGHVFSKHSKDYWEPYYNGGAVPLLYKKYSASSTLNIRPTP
jgi:penicillin amidase